MNFILYTTRRRPSYYQTGIFLLHDTLWSNYVMRGKPTSNIKRRGRIDCALMYRAFNDSRLYGVLYLSSRTVLKQTWFYQYIQTALKVWGFVKSKKVWNQIKIWTIASMSLKNCNVSEYIPWSLLTRWRLVLSLHGLGSIGIACHSKITSSSTV